MISCARTHARYGDQNAGLVDAPYRLRTRTYLRRRSPSISPDGYEIHQ